MKAIQFPGVNADIGENQEEYNTLPAFVGEIPFAEGTAIGLTCCFEFTQEEISEIVRTGVIWHTVLTFGNPLQPQLMTAQKPDWVPDI